LVGIAVWVYHLERAMRSFSLVLFLAFSAFALCNASNCNHTLPDGSTCPTGKGPFTFPDLDHCSRFWQCDNGCATHMLCERDFLYDDKRHWCNTPQLVDCGKRDCDGRPCKPPTPPVDFKCPKADGLFPDAKNCIKYFQCSENIAQEKICPFENGKQLFYDPSHNWCDWPERVSCGERPICDQHDQHCSFQPTLPPTTTRAPNQCDKMGSCIDDGAYIPEGQCSQCFCECSAGRWQEGCCQPSLVFDPSLNQCNWPFNVPSCH